MQTDAERRYEQVPPSVPRIGQPNQRASWTTRMQSPVVDLVKGRADGPIYRRVYIDASVSLGYWCGGNRPMTSPRPKAASARSNVATCPPFRRARPSKYPSVTCFPVVADR